MKVNTRPREGAKSIEFVPVKATVKNEETGDMVEITDADDIKKAFIQERYWSSGVDGDGIFQYFTISLDIDYIGTKLKKVEK
jgi:hypothetical protein